MRWDTWRAFAWFCVVGLILAVIFVVIGRLV